MNSIIAGLIGVILTAAGLLGLNYYTIVSTNPETSFGGTPVLTAPQGGTGFGSTTAGDVGKFLKVSNHNPLTYVFDTAAGGSGGGGGGFWSTTTNELIIYPTSDNYTVSIGDDATTTSEFWFDPVVSKAFLTAFTANNSTSTNATSTRFHISSLFSFGGDVFDELVGDGLDISNGDLIFDCSDVAGTGITCSGEDITASLGTAIDTGEITDGTITEPDLDVDDSPADGECLAYDSTGTNFEWVTCGTGGGGSGAGMATTSIDTESELETILTDVTNVFTNNDTIGTANGGTGLSNPGTLSIGSLLQFNGSSGASAIGAGASGSILKVTADTWVNGSLDLADSDAVGTSILSIANGGTGWANIQSNAIPYGNGTTRLSTTTQGTAGQVLGLVGGVPTWVATSTCIQITGSADLCDGSDATGGGGSTPDSKWATSTDFAIYPSGVTNSLIIGRTNQLGNDCLICAFATSSTGTIIFASSSSPYDADNFHLYSSHNSLDTFYISAGGDMFLRDDATFGGGLTINSLGGGSTLLISGSASTLQVGTAGVTLTDDGDGALTIASFGDTNNEDLTVNLDDTADTAVWSSSTGVTKIDWGAFNLTTTGKIGVASSTPTHSISVGTTGSSYGSVAVTENPLATSTTMTINWANGNQQLVRLGASATTIGFSNASTSGMTLKLVVCNPNATAGAITWNPQILWPGGVAPSQTTTANKCDVWSFIVTQATGTAATSQKIFGAQTQNF